MRHEQGSAKNSPFKWLRTSWRFARVACAAPHNSLNLLESEPERARFNASSRSAVVSSRQDEPKVEFVNHPRSVFASVSNGWAFRTAGDGGWGAPDTARNQRAAHVLMRGTGALERGYNDASAGGDIHIVPRPGSLHSRWFEAAPLPRIRSLPGLSLRYPSGSRRLGQLCDGPSRRASPRRRQRLRRH